MKKRIINSIMIAVIAIVTGYNVYQSKTTPQAMTDIMLANVEALAELEDFSNAGIDWRGHAYDQKNQCCARSIPSAICSGKYKGC